jgi:hypothetical protein
MEVAAGTLVPDVTVGTLYPTKWSGSSEPLVWVAAVDIVAMLATKVAAAIKTAETRNDFLFIG